MTAVRPTKKQRQLLDFISGFIATHGYSPSYREIMNGCGYSSIATVAVHINNLISRGHLRKRDHSARSLEVVAYQDSEAVAGTLGEDPDAAHHIWLLELMLTRLNRPDGDQDESELAGQYLAALESLDLKALADDLQRRLEASADQADVPDTETA